MAKNGVSKGLQDILLQGLGTQTQSSVSSRREERQQLREEKPEDRQAEREARKKGDDESTVAPSSGGDDIGGIGGGPIILNLVTSGTDLNEVLTGTDEVDSLYGGGGNDIIIGRGNPTGAESLYGGTGNDVIFGNSHVDSAYGGDGNDLVEGNHGNDFLQGDDGNDTLLDGPSTGSADQLVSVSGGADFDENSESHSDKIAWAGALGDGSGYVTGWGAGIGALVAPPQALKIQKFNNFGQAVGTPVRIDEYFSATENAGPFELKNDIRVLGLMGSDADKFVVVFESEFQDQTQGNSAHAYMMVFNNNDLSTDLAQFQFSESTDRTQRAPTAAALSNGDLIVAWQEQHRDNNDPSNIDAGIYFRKYGIADNGTVSAVDGLASTTVVGSSGNDYRVNITTNGDQVSPEMAILDNGNVLVAWNSNGNAGEVGDFGVYFRIVNYSGVTPTAVTGEIRVNQTIAGNQEISAKNIAVLSNGNFVVTWNGNGPGDTLGTFFRVFNQNGVAVTNETLVNQTTGLEDIEATVTELPDGGFLVVWTRDNNATPGNPGPGQDTQNFDIYARQFNAAGVAVTDEFRVNTVGDPAFLEDQRRPHVTTLPNGLVVITWDSGRDPQINGPGYSSRDEEVIQQVFVFSPSTGGDDTMNGGSGMDVVLGQSGNDSLFGGLGNFVDTLSGASGADVLHGDLGADSLFGGLGADFANYAASSVAVQVNLNDNLTETGGDAAGDFITGVEHLVGSANNDSLTGIGTLQSGQEAFALNNSIIGGLGSDAIFGLDGNDSLFGDFLPAFAAGGGTDSMFGGLGNDLMYGGDANDFLQGGAGGDTISGDTGTDTADYATSASAVDVRLNDLLAESGGDAQGDTLVGVENLIGSSFNDTLIGNDVANVFSARDGNDTLIGNTGNDQLFGESGNDVLVDGGGLGADVYNGGDGANDTISYLGVPAGVTVNLLAGNGAGGAAGDTYANIEDIVGSSLGDTLIGNNSANDIYGDAGIDTVFGGAGNGIDTLFGGLDNDLLVDGGGGGADSYVGGAGNDAVSYSGTDAGVTADLSTGSGNGDIAAGDFYSQIETLFGSSGGDTLTGNGAVNALVGNLGNDTLTGGAGGDTLDGGGGSDFANYSNSAAAVTVDLGSGATEFGGDAQGDSLAGIEHVYGSSFADTLTGDGGANSLVGQAGNDTLAGAAGADNLIGGLGSDWGSWAGSAAAVDVRLTAASQSGGDAQGDVLSGVENLLGSSQGDLLLGSANDNSIRGGEGDDTVGGGSGAGADFLFGETGNDLLLDLGGGGGDVYDGGSNGSAGDTVSYENEVLGVTVDLTNGVGSVNAASGDVYIDVENAAGGLGNDMLRGNTDVNTLIGNDGNDTVEGGDAADSLFGGTGFDWVDYTNSDWGVTVTLGSTDAQTGEIDGDQIGDVLSGFEAVKGANNGDVGDTLTSVLSSAILDGQLGDDFFIAGAGADTFIGGFGSDTVDYRASSTAVNVNLMTGVGSGGLAAGDLYTEVENVLGSSGDDVMVGIAGTNTLAGFDGNDSLFGGSSTDSLIGDIGDDFLQGGSGGDSIVGGAGSNDFAVYTNDVSQTEGVTVDLSTGKGTGGDASDDTPDVEGNPQSVGDTLFGIEHVIGSGNNDSINGDDGVNWLFGASGIDALRGAGGDDSLFGGDGDDILGGFAPGAVDTGADSLFGGTGNDSLFFDPNDTALVGGIDNDLLIGRSVADSVQLDAARFHFAGGFADIETFDLGDGNDVFLNTSNVADLVNIGQGLNVFGGSGRDQISMRGVDGAFSGMDDVVDGGAGNDFIWGGFGNDGLSGGANDDQIYGGKGDDTFNGGSGFDVFYVGHDEGVDHISDNLAETNGLVLFWGWDSTFGGNFDGIDPTEVTLTYSGNDVRINLENGGEVHFERSFNGSTWETTVDILNLWDYGNGDAGNSPTPPPTFARDVWSATFNATTGEFTAFTLAVNG